MLNQQQRDTFRLALASLNCSTIKNVEELDIDDMISNEQVLETRDTVENFFEARGCRFDRHGNRPATPFEQQSTLLGDVFVWENQQARKGARRGSLYVMDFGDTRATYFSGEA